MGIQIYQAKGAEYSYLILSFQIIRFLSHFEFFIEA